MDASKNLARERPPENPAAPPSRGGSIEPDGRSPRGAKRSPAPEAVAPAQAGPSTPTPAPVTQHPKPSTSEARQQAEAERNARLTQLEAALNERYVLKPATASADQTPRSTEYRFRGDTQRVAFTETRIKLATDINSPSVARSMVDVAESRQWKSLRVSGHEDFKRMVWLEASVRGIQALGYEPTRADQALLQREREARQVNRIEPVPEAAGPAKASGEASPETTKASARGGGGSRKTVLAAIEAVLVAKKVPEAQRSAVMAAAAEKLAQRGQEAPAAKVRVYDLAAPSQRTVAPAAPEAQRSRERAGPAPAR